MTKKWSVKTIRRIFHSIAFYPAIIACFYLALSYLMIQFDFSDTGKQVKTQWDWLRLRDASTARSIISVIAAGILSLAVFSFTMVMVVLNQAASQMSNRVLDKLIGNRFQQIVLGIYIGTIVYSLFLLSAIRDVDKGVSVPSLSTYLLIVIAVVNIFLFIYFLHYITQSVKYIVIIKRIRKETEQELKRTCFLADEPSVLETREGFAITASKAGMFNGFDKAGLAGLAAQYDGIVSFQHPVGTFLVTGSPLATFTAKKTFDTEKAREEILSWVYIEDEAGVEGNYSHGLRQLTEIAVKALSPGINDPGTAVESLRAIAELLSYRMCYHPANSVKDDEGIVRVITVEKRFEDLLEETLLPIWDYGKNDRFVQREMQYLLASMERVTHNGFIEELLRKIKARVAGVE